MGGTIGGRRDDSRINRMGYQLEDGVQVAQRGQVKVQIIKRFAANTFLGFPFEGKLRPQAVMRCSATARYEA